MKVKFHPEARVELIEVIDYYEEKRSTLGWEFFEEVLAAVQRVVDFPNAWSPLSASTRRCLTHRFPFAVIYQVKRNEIRVIAIAHQKRKPGYWQDRLSGF